MTQHALLDNDLAPFGGTYGPGLMNNFAPLRTEFGMLTHTCRFLPDGLLPAQEDGPLFVYKASIMARAQVIPDAYVEAAALIVALPDWPTWASLLDLAVTSEMLEA